MAIPWLHGQIPCFAFKKEKFLKDATVLAMSTVKEKSEKLRFNKKFVVQYFFVSLKAENVY